MSARKSKNRSRKGSPHRNTYIYIDSPVEDGGADEDDDYEREMLIDETVKATSEESESDSTNGGVDGIKTEPSSTDDSGEEKTVDKKESIAKYVELLYAIVIAIVYSSI